jgi:hypothetical protein
MDGYPSELQQIIKRCDRSVLVVICRKMGFKKTATKSNRELKKWIQQNVTNDNSERCLKIINDCLPSISSIVQRSGRRVRSKKRSRDLSSTNQDKEQYSMKNNNCFFPQVQRLLAIGDLHGDLKATILSLKMAGVISQDISNHERDIKKIHWTGGESFVVQLGDQIDRVRPSSLYQNLCRPDDPELIEDEGNDLKIMCLFDQLDKEAREVGGRCISILGNHELMNADGDFRYVSPREFCEFGNYFRASRSQKNRDVPFGYVERKSAFARGGVLAKRMAAYRYAIVQVGSWLFVHGSLHPDVAKKYSISKINQSISNWLLNTNKEDTEDIDFLYHNENDTVSPFWSRLYSDHEDFNEDKKKQFFETLEYVNEVNKSEQSVTAKGMIVGHSPQFMYGKPMNSDLDGRLWRVDVGVSRAFGKEVCDSDSNLRRVQVLEIVNDNNFNVLS